MAVFCFWHTGLFMLLQKSRAKLDSKHYNKQGLIGKLLLPWYGNLDKLKQLKFQQNNIDWVKSYIISSTNNITSHSFVVHENIWYHWSTKRNPRYVHFHWLWWKTHCITILLLHKYCCLPTLLASSVYISWENLLAMWNTNEKWPHIKWN